MNNGLFNMIILVLAAFVGLWEALLLARGKRILKGANGILGLANIGAFVHVLNQVIDNILYMILGVFVLIILYGIICYYFGTEYRIHSQKPELLADLIEKAFGDIEYFKPERNREDRTVRFTTKESEKVIELKEKDASWGDKKVYYIKFKRWLNYESKKEILALIENTLEQEEEHKHSKLKIALQSLAFILLMGFAVVFASKIVMEPKDLRQVVPDELPEAMYLIRTNEIHGDKAVMKELHECFQNSGAFIDNDMTEERLTTTEVSLNYASDKRILYIGRNNITLFVDDAEIGNKSMFHRICWALHQLYDKDNGTYYYVYVDRVTINKLLNKIIDNYY